MQVLVDFGDDVLVGFLLECACTRTRTRTLGAVYYLFLTMFHQSENEPGGAEAETKYWTMFTPFFVAQSRTCRACRLTCRVLKGYVIEMAAPAPHPPGVTLCR